MYHLFKSLGCSVQRNVLLVLTVSHIILYVGIYILDLLMLIDKLGYLIAVHGGLYGSQGSPIHVDDVIY